MSEQPLYLVGDRVEYRPSLGGNRVGTIVGYLINPEEPLQGLRDAVDPAQVIRKRVIPLVPPEPGAVGFIYHADDGALFARRAIVPGPHGERHPWIMLCDRGGVVPAGKVYWTWQEIHTNRPPLTPHYTYKVEDR